MKVVINYYPIKSINIIYVLKLISGKYYIGKTTSLSKRIRQHMTGNGSLWTKMYKPVELIQTYYSHCIFDEDVTTKIMMLKHGIDNVRGGTYTQVILDECKKKVIEFEFRTALDLCFNCGKDTHFKSKCPEYNIKK